MSSRDDEKITFLHQSIQKEAAKMLKWKVDTCDTGPINYQHLGHRLSTTAHCAAAAQSLASLRESGDQANVKHGTS